MEKCGEVTSSPEGSNSTDVSTAAPAAPEAPAKRFITEPTDILYRSIRSKPFLSKMADDTTYHCYEVRVKASEYKHLWVWFHLWPWGLFFTCKIISKIIIMISFEQTIRSPLAVVVRQQPIRTTAWSWKHHRAQSKNALSVQKTTATVVFPWAPTPCWYISHWCWLLESPKCFSRRNNSLKQ